MLLSTSNSEKQQSLRARTTRQNIVLFLGTIAVMLVILEVGTRLIVERRSKVQRMVNAEYIEAIGIRPGSASRPKELLVIGNSLVGHGVDFPLLKQALTPEWEAHRFWIYNTGYDDWYFGLKRLFADGSRPDTVAVVFAAMHWTGTGIRNDYSSQYLFEASDIPAVSFRMGLSLTGETNLLLAHYSKFWALRSDLRKQILDSVIPELPQMYELFKPGPSRQWTSRDVVELATKRMREYRTLVEANGASLVLIVPPVPRPGHEYQDELRTAASRAGIQAVIPMSCYDLSGSEFMDDTHLGPHGQTVFTSKLVKELTNALDGKTAHL